MWNKGFSHKLKGQTNLKVVIIISNDKLREVKEIFQ